MKYKIPNVVNIFGQKIKIIKQSSVDLNGEEVVGLYLPSEAQILINKNQDDKQILLTYFHELAHGIIDRSGINQTRVSPEVQEIICEQFSKFIVEHFKIELKK